MRDTYLSEIDSNITYVQQVREKDSYVFSKQGYDILYKGRQKPTWNNPYFGGKVPPKAAVPEDEIDFVSKIQLSVIDISF
jgi:hypothetical protein